MAIIQLKPLAERLLILQYTEQEEFCSAYVPQIFSA